MREKHFSIFEVKNAFIVLILVLSLLATALFCPVRAEASTSDASRTLQQLGVKSSGKTYYASDYSDKFLVYIFGRTTCTYTMQALEGASSIQNSGVSMKIIFLDTETSDYGLSSLKSTYPKVLVGDSYPYSSTAYSVLLSCGFSSSSWGVPVIAVLDANRDVSYWDEGYNSSALSYALHSASSTRTTDSEITLSRSTIAGKSIKLKTGTKIKKWKLAKGANKGIVKLKQDKSKKCVTVSGKKSGNTTIVALNSKGKIVISYDILVDKPVFKNRVIKSKTSFYIREKIDGLDHFYPTKYKSSNKKVLEIDDYGAVTVKKNGKSRITVWYGDGYKLSATYTVKL